MTDFPRLIEHAFPLKQASLDSVREKYGPKGHISGFHLWPARRPLAASRASLIATLLPDPGDSLLRKELCEAIGGKIMRVVERKKMPGGQSVDRLRDETEGGILRWKRETENAAMVEQFRRDIHASHGNRPPRVLDPFAGGGAIPFEAMRLGCEVTAVDINPVAWFILKCTLEYPHRFAGKTRLLPEFILHNDAFMNEFLAKSRGFGKAETKAALQRLHDRLKKKPRRNSKPDQTSFQFQLDQGDTANELHADLAWHVRAWGHWVLGRARLALSQYYPTYADFEPITKDHLAYERQSSQLVPLNNEGIPDIESLNAEFTVEYLADKRNPRWIAKPTVAYLWARTVTCKNCRAIVPLLKTRWLCKKSNKRVLLTIEPNANRTGVVFGIERAVPSKGGNAAQKREYDKKIGSGTMSRAGAQCPCCNTIMTMEDIRLEGKAGKLGNTMTAVVIDTPDNKAYRLPTEHELECGTLTENQVEQAFSDVPFGVPDEPTPSPEALGMRIPLYGFDKWRKLFTRRQLVSLGTFLSVSRKVRDELTSTKCDDDWIEAVRAYLAASLDRLVDQCTTLCTWYLPGENVKHTYVRYALPMMWDYAETNPLFDGGGSWTSAWKQCAMALEHALGAAANSPNPCVRRASSATLELGTRFDLVMTDPPYYDAIPYSDLMDLFYIWLRRGMFDAGTDYASFADMCLSPKWNRETNDGELIDDESRHGGDAVLSRHKYEDGMFQVFRRCNEVLEDHGRQVVVFAHKDPLAWETLAGALIRAGFVVDASWPIQTENATRSRARSSAALASSLWLICKKRSAAAKPGWDHNVLQEMKSNIAVRLRDFWDAGIRGPDFVWAATGPALEAYSKHPVVRKANEPNATMGVGEFLIHVRRMVVDYVVGQVLSGEQGADTAAADRLDEVTAYYLLHRHDFGLDDAPVGACILYATACGLTDGELEKTWDLLSHAGSDTSSSDDNVDDSAYEDDSAEDDEPVEDLGGGSKLKLRPWYQRRNRNMGYEAPEGRAVPLIDRIHRVMHLWKDGDVQKVDEYIDQHALRRNELFRRVVQSLIELSTNSERSLLESISNHVGAKGAIRDRGPTLPFGEDE